MIWAIFYLQEERFLSSVNLTNLVLQATAVGLVAIGVVLVLLLARSTSRSERLADCARRSWPCSPRRRAGRLTWRSQPAWRGTAIGFFQGSIFTRFGIASFVVTLAGLLVAGVPARGAGRDGTVNITDPKITGLTNTFYSDTVGWIIGILAIAAFAGFGLLARQRRAGGPARAAHFDASDPHRAGRGCGAGGHLGPERRSRVPLAALILVGFVLFFFITTKTTFGRHIFAVGGNAEAARRAGINVRRVRDRVHDLVDDGGDRRHHGRVAPAGGEPVLGRPDFLLLAIAAPVIAGTSLFGGRGSVWHALLGALVIQSISNGMDLLGLSSSVKFIVTGAVLLAAVMVDAIARQQRAADA